MRRESDEVAEAARRRLELLGRELARSGVGPPGPDPDGGAGVEAGGEAGAEAWGEAWDGPELEHPTSPMPTALAEPGRHSRVRPTPLTGRGVAWLQDRLPATLRGRVSLGVGHVAVLAVVAAVALAVTAYVTVRARPSVATAPRPHTSPAALVSSPSGAASPGPSTSAGPTTAPALAGTVVVDVAGKVRRPGVTTLPAGSRVVDAIRQAGGARPGVDLTSLNLARVLVDGEQILVGSPAAPGVAASASAEAGAAAAAGPLVNLNTAALDQLETLPGVGPVTAQKFLDWRGAHGRFNAVDELLEVDGIGPKTLAQLAPHVTL